MTPTDDTTASLQDWFDQPRFDGILRLYSARQVAAQRGSIASDYPVARDAATAFHARLRELFAEGRSITTFGPYSPGQAVTMKRLGIEGIYLGGWATSAKGSADEDPGADLASYPLGQVPSEAAALVRALLAADRNQHYVRSQMSAEERRTSPVVDFRPFIIADADAGHGGDAHVRNLIRRFGEACVPGYHIEDQRPGSKKCGHQGGKVLVSVDEQIRRLNAARFQLDIMGVPGILVARTDAEAATLLDGGSDERDHPFILGATNLDLPPYKDCSLAVIRSFHEAGVEELNGHLLYALSTEQFEAARDWLDDAGVLSLLDEAAAAARAGRTDPAAALDSVSSAMVEAWESEAGLKTYGDAVAEILELRLADGHELGTSVEEWRGYAGGASRSAAVRRAESLGVVIDWSSGIARTPEGYLQIRGGIDYAIAKSLAVAPFSDILWMETKTADLADAREFAEAVHAHFPDKMLAYNLSPSFNWDTTGMSDDEMRSFPEELGKLGFVFNFITYGGHQVDGLAGEEFATALKQDGMLALARLQRKLRLVESPYKTPQSLVGGPRFDAALMASSGRTATTKAMGKGSTQFQHLVQTEVPVKLLESWLALWTEHYGLPGGLRVLLRPHRAGSELLELQILGEGPDPVANVIFSPMKDRHGRSFLSVRDQNTFAEELRMKRLMTLIHLFMVHRYKATAVHYVSPTDDNRYQTRKMKGQGVFSEVHTEVGDIIVAQVDAERIKELLASDRKALQGLIEKIDKRQAEQPV